MSDESRVGPKTIKFQFGDRTIIQTYDVPSDTMDPRYLACSEHHPACDCREAELAEQIGEYQSDRRDFELAVARVLVTHRLHDYGDDVRGEAIPKELRDRYRIGDGPLTCQCTGCQIGRAGHARFAMTNEHGIVAYDAAKWAR